VVNVLASSVVDRGFKTQLGQKTLNWYIQLLPEACRIQWQE
jgi:hypothetical protein